MDTSFATLAMSTPTIVLSYAAAFFFVVVAIAAAYALFKAGGTLGRVDTVLSDVDREAVPLLQKAGTTLDGVNANLGNVDQITKDVADITDKIDAMATAVEGAVSTPARKAASFSAGVQGAVSSFMRRDKTAPEGGSAAAGGASAGSTAPATGAAESFSDAAAAAAAATAERVCGRVHRGRCGRRRRRGRGRPKPPTPQPRLRRPTRRSEDGSVHETGRERRCCRRRLRVLRSLQACGDRRGLPADRAQARPATHCAGSTTPRHGPRRPSKRARARPVTATTTSPGSCSPPVRLRAPEAAMTENISLEVPATLSALSTVRMVLGGLGARLDLLARGSGRPVPGHGPAARGGARHGGARQPSRLRRGRRHYPARHGRRLQLRRAARPGRGHARRLHRFLHPAPVGWSTTSSSRRRTAASPSSWSSIAGESA